MNSRISMVTILTLLLAVISLPVSAQNQNDDGYRSKLHYAIGGSRIDTTLMNNSSSTRDLFDFLERLKTTPDAGIVKIELFSSASMEGDVYSNRKLNARRNASVSKWIQELTHVPDSLIQCYDLGIAWNELRYAVDTSNMKYREEVLYIIDNVPEETWENGWLVDSRNKHLMDLRGGRPYRYMGEAFFPYFRYTKVRITYYGNIWEESDKTLFQAGMSEDGNDTEEKGSMLYIEAVKAEPDSLTVVAADTTANTAGISTIAETVRTPFLSVKTNGLMLLGGIANAGVEARIADHFSIDFPVTYTPYTIKRNYKIRALAMQPEFRYWFKGFSEGHFIGLTGNFAWFNIALDNDNRYQDSKDRPLMGAGISYGYAFKLMPNLRLELTVGAGYANIHYDVFYNVENGIKYNSGIKNYWGLTKAGVNIVYVFNLKRGR